MEATSQIGVAASTPTCRPQAHATAIRLGLPVCEPGTTSVRFLLLHEPEGLSLKDTQTGLTGVRADWCTRAVRRRVTAGSRQLFARALGLHKRRNIRILDGCAGLGVDGFVLAGLGARLTMTERHPVVCALLRHALSSVQQESPKWLHQPLQISVCNLDARNWLEECPAGEYPDAIYLDPMYPDRGKSALPGKDMQVLQALLGHSPRDDEDLLQSALSHARHRVVVKRPLRASFLLHEPDFSKKGKQTRFDIYFTGKTGTDATET